MCPLIVQCQRRYDIITCVDCGMSINADGFFWGGGGGGESKYVLGYNYSNMCWILWVTEAEIWIRQGAIIMRSEFRRRGWILQWCGPRMRLGGRWGMTLKIWLLSDTWWRIWVMIEKGILHLSQPMVVLYGCFHLSESKLASLAFVEGCRCWAKATCGGEDQLGG